MTDYIQRLRDDLAEQFKDKPVIEALNKVIGRQLNDVRQYFDDLRNERYLDGAVGKQLDNIGDIVGLSRLEAGELACESESVYVLNDDDYRTYLRYRIALNTNSCTYRELMTGLETIWGVSPVYYSEETDVPATIIFSVPLSSLTGETSKIDSVPTVRPAGVRALFRYYAQADTALTHLPTCVSGIRQFMSARISGTLQPKDHRATTYAPAGCAAYRMQMTAHIKGDIHPADHTATAPAPVGVAAVRQQIEIKIGGMNT